MRLRDRGGLRFVDLPLGDGVLATVTTRHGGVSTGPYTSLNLADHVGDDPAAVHENRRRVCEALGLEALTVADQRHGATVAVVDEACAGAGHSGTADARARLPSTDGLVTDRPGVALAVLVADCQPVVLWDPVQRAVGVAHAGRRGTLLGVVPAVVDAMVGAYGSRPGDLRAAIGPHVAGGSYEVGPTEVAEVEAAFGGAGLDLLTPTADGRALLALEPAVRRQLETCGVEAAAIGSTGIDTRTSTRHLFSDRAARPCGRFALVACLRAG